MDHEEGRADGELPEGWGLPESLVEFAPDALLVIDSIGTIRRVNAQLEAMFGYRRDELLGRAVGVLLPPRIHDRDGGHGIGYFPESGLRPMGAELERLGRRKDGTEFPVDVMLSPVGTAEGPLVFGMVRDTTERKRFEQALRQKNIELEDASLAKNRFLAGTTHELRTPLNAIIGFTGTLLMKLPGPLTAEQDKQLQTVRTSAKHLLSLVDDLLDLARIESGRMELNFEPVLCLEVIDEVAGALRPLAETKGLALAIEAAQEHLVLHTDRRVLSQILINLLNNAIKFTERGRVRIEIARRRARQQRLIEISVADTGVGIRPEDQARLFQPFTRVDVSSARRHEGTGLGLHLSQKLADLIGGRITLCSEYGRGSTVTLEVEEG